VQGFPSSQLTAEPPPQVEPSAWHTSPVLQWSPLLHECVGQQEYAVPLQVLPSPWHLSSWVQGSPALQDCPGQQA